MNVKKKILRKPLPVIFGIKGYILNDREKIFFKKTNPLGFIFFDEVPDLYTWTGAILIFGSTTYIAVREARLKRYSGKNG